MKQTAAKKKMSWTSGLDIGKARIAVADSMKGFKKPGKGASKIK
jgi:hypothetical protein